MTLVLRYNYGGQIAALTSDTRLSIRVLNKDYPVPMTREDKIMRLSKYVACGGGGRTRIVDEIQKRLMARVSPDTGIDECHEHLNEVIEEMKAQKKYAADLKSMEDVQFLMTGFHKKQVRTGWVSYNPEEGVKFEMDMRYEAGMAIIAPSTDHFRTIINQANENVPKASNVRENANYIINYLSYIQLAHYKIDPSTVSEKCCYALFFKDPITNKLEFREGTIDLSNW